MPFSGLFFSPACTDEAEKPSSGSLSESLSQTASIVPASSLESSSESAESESSSYHLKLHDIDLEPPAEEVCLAARKRVFTGMSEDDIQLVKDTIHEWHTIIEAEFVDHNMRN